MLKTGTSTRTLRHVLYASSEAETIDAPDDWESLEARIAIIPESAQVRGMFVRELFRIVPSLRMERRYLPFSNYPMREYVALVLNAARIAHPKLPAANAVFKVGLGVYSVFASSVVGTAIFSVAQHDFRRALEVSPKAYALSMSPVTVTIAELEPGYAEVQMRNFWLLPDVYQSGVLLGAMKVCGAEGTARVTRHAPCDVDIELRWQPRPP